MSSNSEFKERHFTCSHCGYDFGIVKSPFEIECPHCKSSLTYNKISNSCYPPSAPLWIPAIAWILLAFGIGNALFQTPLASYGLLSVCLSLPFFFWSKNNKMKEQHAEKLHDAFIRKKKDQI